jgi:hypothetical protein
MEITGWHEKRLPGYSAAHKTWDQPNQPRGLAYFSMRNSSHTHEELSEPFHKSDLLSLEAMQTFIRPNISYAPALSHWIQPHPSSKATLREVFERNTLVRHDVRRD